MIPIDNSSLRQTLDHSVKDSFLNADSLNGIKTMGRANDPQALKEVAKKFEAIFVQQMLKSMRAANEVFSEDSYFNSNEMQFHQDMYDQQMSLELTNGKGLGLADALYAQMQRSYGTEQTDTEKSVALKDLSAQVQYHKYRPAQTLVSSTKGNSALAATANTGGKKSIANTPENFVEKLTGYAEKAAASLGVDTNVLLAQAALETGWGNHVIHTEHGENSFNLFNIKAGASWSGEKVKVTTLEYSQGVAQQERANFRRYNNYEESFNDYVNFLQTNPRYQQALAAGTDASAYAEELQKAGYATDPAYAEKIKHIVNGDTLRDKSASLALLSSSNDQ